MARLGQLLDRTNDNAPGSAPAHAGPFLYSQVNGRQRRGSAPAVARRGRGTVPRMVALDALRADLAAGGGWLLGAPSSAGAPRANRKDRLAKAAGRRSVDARRAADEARAAAHEIAVDVWTATDAADLDDIIDAAVDNPRTGKQIAKVTRALFNGDLPELVDAASFARAIKGKTAVGTAVLPDLFEGFRIMSVTADLPRAATPSDDVDDYTVPVSLLRCKLAMMRALVSLAALVDLVVSHRPTPPAWLMKRVVRAWVDGQRSFLRIAAARNVDADVPEDLLPTADRITIDQLFREHSEGERVFAEVISRSRAIGDR